MGLGSGQGPGSKTGTAAGGLLGGFGFDGGAGGTSASAGGGTTGPQDFSQNFGGSRTTGGISLGNFNDGGGLSMPVAIGLGVAAIAVLFLLAKK